MLIEILRRTCNRLLRNDPQARRELDAIEGKVVELRLSGLEPAFVRVMDGQLYVQSEADEAMEVAVVLRTTPGNFMAMLRAASSASSATADDQSMPADDGAIEGDAAVLHCLLAVLGRQWDWEEQLATVIGDAPARKAGWVGRTVASLVAEARNDAAADLGWYLKDDSELVVRRDEVEAFAAEVEALRATAQGLERRVQNLVKSRAAARARS